MKRRIQKLEFYITNVCNLDCPDCNRFNNHSFRGHQLWQDYAKDYQEWARQLDVSGLVILGGEPLLNPTICDWIRGISNYFGMTVQVLSNGTRLNKTPGLYSALMSQFDNVYCNWIGISVHNTKDLHRYFDEVTKFLQGNIKEYHGKDARNLAGNMVSFGADHTFIDENNVAVRIWIQDSFYPAAIHAVPPQNIDGKWQAGGLTVYNNDPYLAHEACGFAQFKNYHMIRGKLHKCGPCVLLSDFDKQTPLMITDQDREIMQAYRALSPWDAPDIKDEFFKRIDEPIPQCKFCPVQEQMNNKTIFARSKKSGSTGTFD